MSLGNPFGLGSANAAWADLGSTANYPGKITTTTGGTVWPTQNELNQIAQRDRLQPASRPYPKPGTWEYVSFLIEAKMHLINEELFQEELQKTIVKQTAKKLKKDET